MTSGVSLKKNIALTYLILFDSFQEIHYNTNVE